jgi:acyl-CoA thioesterase-2
MSPPNLTSPGLATTLQLEPLGPGVFRGRIPATPLTRVFGGHLVGQALLAAMPSIPEDRLPHSLKTSFLRPGSTTEALDYHVRELREGSTFSTRQVLVIQGGVEISQVTVSFTVPGDGGEHQPVAPAAPDPNTLPTLAENVAREPGVWPLLYQHWRDIDVRHVLTPSQRLRSADPADRQHAQVWLRAEQRQPDDPRWHACVLAYLSDLTLLSVALPVLSLLPGQPGLTMASLDHDIWFHRPTRVDDWLLYDQTCASAAAGLALVTGRLFTRSGELVVSVVQQGLIRLRDPVH